MARSAATLLLMACWVACVVAGRPGLGELPSTHLLGHSASRASDLQTAQHRPLSVRSDQVPGIELAARQKLFNYATQQGLDILKTKIQDLVIPDVAKSFNLPIVGDFKLQLSAIRINQFNASSREARLTIMDERFELWITEVEVALVFDWHWEKLGMQGTGSGELDLHGGSIDYQFRVTTSDQGKPHIMVDEAGSRFTSVDLKIRSFSADWLYQAVMNLFNDQIQKAVQNGIAGALQGDVPAGLNRVLDTLPTRLDVTGLPFSTSFEYSIFTLTYVMVKGYGEVESDTTPHVTAGDSNAATSMSATAEAATGTAAQAVPETAPAGAMTGRSGSAGLAAMAPCPFAATPLPLSSEQVAADGHMTSIYLHESVANCMLWGLYRTNALKYDLVDGAVPKLHLTTDLLGMLIPQLPKAYPHQLLRIYVEALEAPHVAFTAAGGTTGQAVYRTSVYVANETEGNPKIVTLSANLTVKGQLNFDSTIITSAEVHHTVEESTLPVSAAQWDNTVAWFIQNYAGLYPLQFLIDHFVQTPVTSLVSLVDAEAKAYDGWFALSGDVLVHPNRRRIMMEGVTAH